jgi:hypothetical protein
MRPSIAFGLGFLLLAAQPAFAQNFFVNVGQPDLAGFPLPGDHLNTLSVVPEPGSFAVLAIGGLGLL